MILDPRLTLVRGDLADAALEGLVPAARYAPATAMQVSAAVVPLRRAPAPDAEQLSQLLFGEAFHVLEEGAGFAFGQARRDGYVGFVDVAALSAPVLAPTHRVTALRAYAYAEPSIKSAPMGLYSMNALVTLDDREGRFARAARTGWFVEAQLALVGSDFVPDIAATALRFLGAPYQWGGRESLGLDCSGLVQAAMQAAGRACPRDSDMQQAMGAPVAPGDLARDDLVFWRGHVAILLDADRIVHANAHHMAVALEDLAEAMARIAAAGGGQPLAYRRP